jgi:hypothetical protein
MGIYSLSDRQPMKTGNFSPADESFAEARKYSDWKFFYTPPTTAAQAPDGSQPGNKPVAN